MQISETGFAQAMVALSQVQAIRMLCAQLDTAAEGASEEMSPEAREVMASIVEGVRGLLDEAETFARDQHHPENHGHPSPSTGRHLTIVPGA